MTKKTAALVALMLLLVLPLAGQRRPSLNDGDMHGDAPYLLEDGWTPLLNGKDLAGWHGQGTAKNEWLTTTAILWERLLGPTRLSAAPGPAPGGVILNGPGGRTVNLVSGEKFGDVELYLEFMIAKGSNSGVYLHGLYEVQIFDSWGSTEPMTSSDCGAIYHRWINKTTQAARQRTPGLFGCCTTASPSRRAWRWTAPPGPP